jgi:IS30 family transposase
LINGAFGTGNFVTLVERKSRYTLIGYVGSKSSAEVCSCVCELMKEVPAHLRQTLPFDNGKEFAGHVEMSEVLGLDVFGYQDE